MSYACGYRGIVTAVHGGVVSMWNRHTGAKELRFAHQPGMKPGSKVDFEWDKALDWDAVQPGRIRLYEFQTESAIQQYATKDGVDTWMARTEVIFAPPDSEYLQELQAVVCLSMLKGLAFSLEFGVVGLFTEKVVYQPGEVYELAITR